MRRTALAIALYGIALGAVGSPALAQSDTRPLLDRLDRIERDMNMLQRQVYRGTGPSGAPVAVSPADPQSAANNEVRFGQLEEQMRTITGQIEEVNYNLDQLKRRFETFSNDVDQRLTLLERGAAAAPAGSEAPAAFAPGAASSRGRSSGRDPSEPASRAGTLGQMPVPREQQTATAAPPAAAADPGTLPTGSPQEQYDHAFRLLRQANYPGAEQELRSFIQRYPNDALAGNAQYWLGETYFVRKDYNNAAAVFAEGYQKYPKGGKAADNLLKLGLSLAQLGQKADACRSFARLDRDFPSAPAGIKDRAVEEKKHLGC
jgi:tol-pal system protein YbgF